MNIYYGLDWYKRIRTVDLAFFKELIDFLHQSTSAPTLRDIKERFPDLKVETAIDKYISIGLLFRKNRRYYLNINIYSNKLEVNFFEWLSSTCRNIDPLSDVQRISVILELAELSEDNDSLFAYKETDEFSVFRKKETKTIKICECTLGESQLSMLWFFDANLRKKATFNEKLGYIGDVDSTYYFDQIEVILEKIAAERKHIKATIFSRSLMEFGFIHEYKNSFDSHLVANVEDTQIDMSDFKESFKSFSGKEKRRAVALLMSHYEFNSIQKIEVSELENIFFAIS